jgi:hypothetical protein
VNRSRREAWQSVGGGADDPSKLSLDAHACLQGCPLKASPYSPQTSSTPPPPTLCHASLKYSQRPDGQGAAVLAAVDDLLGSGILVSAFIYINWAYDAVDRRAIEGALARAPDEQREAVMSVMAQEREQGRVEGRAEGKAEGKAETLLRLLERRFLGVPETYHAQVVAADANQLDSWIDAVLDAESIDAVFSGPTAH